MVNTADAYGFPPFEYLAPVCLLGDGDYAELQRRERAVLTAAVSTMRTRQIASSSFGIPYVPLANFVHSGCAICGCQG